MTFLARRPVGLFVVLVVPHATTMLAYPWLAINLLMGACLASMLGSFHRTHPGNRGFRNIFATLTEHVKKAKFTIIKHAGTILVHACGA